MQQITLTPYSEPQLKELIYDMVRLALNDYKPSQEGTPEKFIKGIHELAKFLQVSPAKAQQLKNQGAFPFWQDGRTLLFDPQKVRLSMNSKTK